MADTCEKCGEDYTCRRCACMRGVPDPSPQPGVSDNVIGQCSKCGRPWLADHVCGEISKQAQEAMDDVVTASIEAAKRLFPGETDEPVFVGHALPDQTGVSDGCGVAVHRAPIAELLGVYNYSANLDLNRPNVEPGKWFPTDAQALAEMRERIVAVLADEASTLEGDADAVLRALFGDAS